MFVYLSYLSNLQITITLIWLDFFIVVWNFIGKNMIVHNKYTTQTSVQILFHIL